MAPFEICPTCGAGESFLVPVWEDLEDAEAGERPDYIGCTECHTMKPTEEV
ncbi:hypothetical protein M197_gp19 [Haloarcula hispanica tailed virus 2]|uniref:Uncharacterized protein n=1 Tax=Haloarcula hispanica tailed virus 2 TaxID=1273751 RepID=R4T675_9CAUD|nr:hypothetical protein M197_gp19 [Haloarcula hispanica tailed virus 2]AGM11184.1 hypothetical protein HHTV2_19 [Haloarcula hispanica tailed virus 2]